MSVAQSSHRAKTEIEKQENKRLQKAAVKDEITVSEKGRARHDMNTQRFKIKTFLEVSVVIIVTSSVNPTDCPMCLRHISRELQVAAKGRSTKDCLRFSL